MSSSVRSITSWDELMKALEKSELAVLEFTSPWSDPCKYMKPKLENVASAKKDIANFYALSISILDFKQLAENLGVEALPAFMLVHKFYVKQEVVGVDVEELEKAIDDVSKAIKIYK